MTYPSHSVVQSHILMKVHALGILLRFCKADDYVTCLILTVKALLFALVMCSCQRSMPDSCESRQATAFTLSKLSTTREKAKTRLSPGGADADQSFATGQPAVRHARPCDWVHLGMRNCSSSQRAVLTL